MQKRGAIGLSINTIVIVIISIVILGFGISLLYQFIGGAEQIKGQLDERTNAELESLLVSQGKKVALPFDKATVIRGESHVFGLGVLNVDAANSQYNIEVKFEEAFDTVQKQLPGLDQAQIYTWLLYNNEPIQIPEGGKVKESILVSPDLYAPKGTYIFSVRVMKPSSYPEKERQYGNTQKFYIKVI